jgi:hypothetical protein
MEQNPTNLYTYTGKQVALFNLMRMLWEQHALWTRSIIISIAHDLPDLDPVTKRLLRNPSDFAKVFSMFYGPAKADMMKKLLEQHLIIAGEMVKAAKAGNDAVYNEQKKKWYENADDIAAFLSAINPRWDKKTWQDMLHKHLQMVEREAVNRLTGKYETDVNEYDLMEEQELEMADYMAVGIINQFDIE